MINIYKVNAELCAALGLNPEHITSVTIRLTSKSAPQVEVVYVGDTDRFSELAGALKKYRLSED